jgi:hypothetical protein
MCSRAVASSSIEVARRASSSYLICAVEYENFKNCYKFLHRKLTASLFNLIKLDTSFLIKLSYCYLLNSCKRFISLSRQFGKSRLKVLP